MDERTAVSTDTATADIWDEAYRRIDTYLVALGVERSIFRHSLVRQVMSGATQVLHPAEDRPPLEAAMQVLGKEITDWIGDVLNLSSPDGEEAFLQTRLALLLANMPCRWDTVFMADAPVPEALAAALRETLQSVPRFSPGRMELNPLELGLVPHLAEAALHTLEGTPWLRVIVAWGSFASLFGFLFYLTR